MPGRGVTEISRNSYQWRKHGLKSAQQLDPGYWAVLVAPPITDSLPQHLLLSLALECVEGGGFPVWGVKSFPGSLPCVLEACMYVTKFLFVFLQLICLISV